METFVATLVAVVLLVGLVALVRRMRATRSVYAAEVVRFDGDPAAVDAALRQALAGLAGARVAPMGPGAVEVVLRRSPAWTVLVAMIAFPVGLVALLYREDVPLAVRVYAVGAGTEVHLTGQTEAHVLARTLAAVRSVRGVATGAVLPDAVG
jgi:hypothetical protein